jgi:hypothetical protein
MWAFNTVRALAAGTISKEQFLDLNERVGGFDNDGNINSMRAVGDIGAIRAAYRTGRLTSGGGGLASTPIIDYRNYLDDDKDGNVHVRYHSFSLRERLIKANGHADNHVIWSKTTARAPVLCQSRLSGSAQPDGSLADQAVERHVNRSSNRKNPPRQTSGSR